MYEFYNPNPCNRLVGDCVIRAITKVLDKDWETIYMDIALKGFQMCDMPSSNAVWGAYLSEHGFKKKMIMDGSDAYTIMDFSRDNPSGTFVLATGTHAVALIDGTYFDSGDRSYGYSGNRYSNGMEHDGMYMSGKSYGDYSDYRDSRGRYSRDDMMERTKSQIERLMNESQNEEVREALQGALQRLH